MPAILLGLELLTGCTQTKEDPEVFKNILTDYFDGMKSTQVDLDKLNALTTTDFVLFENGVIWTNDSLAKPIPGVNSFSGRKMNFLHSTVKQ